MKKDLERLKTLIEMDILDTEPEKMFDDISELAAKICNMPVALLTLLDLDRQFFKSNYGLNIKETPIEHSFCKIAIENPYEIFIVEDARRDARFINNPVVHEDPKIVSYYGVPLNSKSKVAFGTLCVLDFEVKILTEEQKNALIMLSRQIEYLLELRIKNKLLIEYQSKIERYSKDMEDFAFLAAHDLKSPIRTIDSFVKILDKKHTAIWDEEDKKYISFINFSAVKMNNLIRDLLEYAKSNVEIDNFESVNVKELIVEIFNNLTFGNHKDKPILLCNEMPTIFSSKIALTVLFNNLISNALNYRKENEPPVIEILYLEETAKWIFTVKDNGIGMKQESLSQIFSPFKRLHNNSEIQGSGLGLAACAKIVDNLKGKITVDSTVGEGTTFTIYLPKE